MSTDLRETEDEKLNRQFGRFFEALPVLERRPQPPLLPGWAAVLPPPTHTSFEDE